MIDKTKVAVFHDEKNGIIWLPEEGKLKLTTPENAARIVKMLQDIESRYISDDESDLLYEYLTGQNTVNQHSYYAKEKADLLQNDHLEKLEIMVANDCNLACKYCYASGGTYQKQRCHMEPEKARAYIKALIYNRYKYINNILFFGGEPTICSKTIRSICDYINELYRQGKVEKLPLYTMVTNATLIDDDIIETIKKNDIKVTVSIDGPKAINDVLRIHPDNRGTFDEIYKAVKKMQNAGIEIRLAEVTFTSLHQQRGYTKNQIEEFIHNELGIKDVLIFGCEDNPCHPELVYLGDNNEIKADRLSKKYIYRRMLGLPGTGIVCESGFGAVAMMPDGSLYPCHYFVNNEDYCISKYDEKGYDFSDYPEFIRKYERVCHYKNPKCNDCWAKYTCNMCAAGVIVRDMEACEDIKKAQIKALFEFAEKRKGVL